MFRLLSVIFVASWCAAGAAQVTWINANPATAPIFRKYSTMVWDSVRQRVLLFAGQGDLETYYNDTWEWDGVRWTELWPAQRPPEREDHMMAFDRDRGRAVIFGGHDVNVRFFDDTWEWDGTTWLKMTTPVKPAPTAYAAMAYDPVRRVAVMYGGLNQSLVEVGHTWEWTGTDWIPRHPANSPGARSHVAMAWDANTQRVVLYGGYVTSTGWRNDHWAWTGTNWVQVTTGPNMMDMRMVFDTVRSRLVIWGGRMQPGDKSWEFVGGQWIMRSASGEFPVARQAHTMAFDERNGETVMFAGYDDNLRYGETWVYRASVTASSASYGHGCGGSAAREPGLALEAGQRPWLGDTIMFRVDRALATLPAVLSLGASRTLWHGIALPIDLSTAGMTGCDLLAGPDVVLPMTSAGAAASLPLALGTNPLWLGRSFYAQAAVADTSANAGGLAFSNGLHLRVGGR
jgi:hypothetical protein